MGTFMEHLKAVVDSSTMFDATTTMTTTTPISWEESPLHDQTLNWSTSTQRLWLNPKNEPPAMLLLTNFGWNNPNTTAGVEVYRGLRARELVQGVITHPWFHPTAWEDINSGKLVLSPTTRYYVFLDRDTCAERNYPHYMQGLGGNRDAVGGRGQCCGVREHFIHQVMNSTVMSSPNAKFVLFECGGMGPKRWFQWDRLLYNGSNLVFASLSASKGFNNPQPQDLGLPPPAQHPCSLSYQQRLDIESCNAEINRTLLLSYTGQLRTVVRQQLAALSNDNDVVVGLKPESEEDAKARLQTLAMNSIFSAAPRGDNLFSYRFTEVMSCGSIPVVHADDWLYPFAPQLLNWSSIAVIIPESQVNETVDVLRDMPLDERCRRRKLVLETYDRYMKDGEATIHGIIDSLESRAKLESERLIQS